MDTFISYANKPSDDGIQYVQCMAWNSHWSRISSWSYLFTNALLGKMGSKTRVNRYLLTVLAFVLFVALGGWTFSHWNDEGMTAKNFQAGTIVVTFLFVASLEMIWKQSNAGKG